MPRITIMPHKKLCPKGLSFEANDGDNLIEVLLAHNIPIEHACEMQCACATCHVYIREGLESLSHLKECEEERLNIAWGLDMDSRLSCQVVIGKQDLVIEIPKYSVNS